MLNERVVVRRRAAAALAGDGAQPRPVLDKLTAALADDDQAVRRDAATAIAHVGPDAFVAVRGLTANLRRGDESSTTAALALGTIGVAARSAAPALIAVIRAAGLDQSVVGSLSDSDRLRSTCAIALGRIDPGGKATADLPVEVVRKRDWVVREALAPSLAGSPSRSVVTATLVDLTTDPNELVRVNARCALRELKAYGPSPGAVRE